MMSDYGADENPDMNITQKIAHEYNFMPLPRANVMMWDGDSTTPYLKIAHRQTATNIHFKFDKNA